MVFEGAASLANGAAASVVLGQSDFTSSTRASTATGMNVPSWVTLDLLGRVYVADENNHRMVRY
jgi:hypothetical protein